MQSASNGSRLALPADIVAALRCPICRGALSISVEVCCTACGSRFPVVDRVPILINESNSLFRLADFAERRLTFFRPQSKMRRRVSAALPSISTNLVARRNLQRLLRLLVSKTPRPRLLVVGGSTLGEGMDLVAREELCLVESDVAFGPRTQVVCDAHDLPFADLSFDGVVAQAVLEHVVDPSRCVAEIYRVLDRGGLVYAEIPFMQQVHGGAYDFTRFTHLGCLRLFRSFEEVDSGVAGGPGMALAWAYCHLLMSFAATHKQRMVLRGIGRMTSFFLKWLDPLLVRRPGAVDAASAFFVMARRGDAPVDDRDLLKRYRGLS